MSEGSMSHENGEEDNERPWGETADGIQGNYADDSSSETKTGFSEPDPDTIEDEDSTRSGGSEHESQSTETSQQVPRRFRNAKTNRTEFQVYVDDDIEDDIQDLNHHFQKMFDSNVRKFDYRAALMRVAIEHSDEVEAVMREYGYGIE